MMRGPTSVQRHMCIFMWKQGRENGCALRGNARRARHRCRDICAFFYGNRVGGKRLCAACRTRGLPSRGVVMNSGVERRAERLGDARALVLLDDEGRRQDEDVAEARHRRRVAADDDAGVRAAPHDGAAGVVI